jgi:hypothetical protein
MSWAVFSIRPDGFAPVLAGVAVLHGSSGASHESVTAALVCAVLPAWLVAVTRQVWLPGAVGV